MNENQKGKPKESFKTPIILCYQCGRIHTGDCILKNHPDANKDSKVKFADTAAGKIFAAQGFEGLNSTKRVEGQILRPMEQKFQDEIKSQFKSYANNTVTKPKGKFLQLNLENKMDELTSPYCCQTTSEEMNMLFDAEV